MTKFEELEAIISGKKTKSDDSLEVAGSEPSKTPLLSCGDHETDPDITDMLYRKAKHQPNNGSGSAPWYSDF